MTAQKLDGKAVLATIKEELRTRVARLTEQGATPGLASRACLMARLRARQRQAGQGAAADTGDIRLALRVVAVGTFWSHSAVAVGRMERIPLGNGSFVAWPAALPAFPVAIRRGFHVRI